METLETPHLLPSREERRKIEELRRMEASRGILEIKKRLKETLVKLTPRVYLFLFLGVAG